jgi:predicted lipid-binding transport protein (Tim44 family)
MYLDILLFAIAAVFIAVKVFNTLGKNEGIGPNKASNIINLSGDNFKVVTPEEPAQPKDDDGDIIATLSPALAKKVAEIKKIDVNFNLNKFLEGSSHAFEMIITAFAKLDKKTLQDLTNKKTYDIFADQIEAITKLGNQLEITVVSILKNQLKAIKLNGNIAEVKIAIDSEQISSVKDAKGKVINGSTSDIQEVEDIWVFSKNLKSSNPIWHLVQIDA